MLLEIKDLNTFYEQSHILQGISLGIDTGRDRLPPGTQRGGQEHHSEIDHRPGHPPVRARFSSRAGTWPGCRPHDIAKLGVGYVPEERRIFPTLSVRENLIMGIKPGQKSNGDGWTHGKGVQILSGPAGPGQAERRDSFPAASSRC